MLNSDGSDKKNLPRVEDVNPFLLAVVRANAPEPASPNPPRIRIWLAKRGGFFICLLGVVVAWVLAVPCGYAQDDLSMQCLVAACLVLTPAFAVFVGDWLIEWAERREQEAVKSTD